MIPSPQPEPVGKGELEYGSITSTGDWRLRKFDAGMGETEYRIFKNETFFAQFDNRKDAETVMTVMTHQSERDTVLDRLDKEIAIRENEMNRKGGLTDNIVTASGYYASAGALNWVRVVLIDGLRQQAGEQE
jgi:hypothetical protein